MPPRICPPLPPTVVAGPRPVLPSTKDLLKMSDEGLVDLLVAYERISFQSRTGGRLEDLDHATEREAFLAAASRQPEFSKVAAEVLVCQHPWEYTTEAVLRVFLADVVKQRRGVEWVRDNFNTNCMDPTFTDRFSFRFELCADAPVNNCLFVSLGHCNRWGQREFFELAGPGEKGTTPTSQTARAVHNSIYTPHHRLSINHSYPYAGTNGCNVQLVVLASQGGVKVAVLKDSCLLPPPEAKDLLDLTVDIVRVASCNSIRRAQEASQRGTITISGINFSGMSSPNSTAAPKAVVKPLIKTPHWAYLKNKEGSTKVINATAFATDQDPVITAINYGLKRADDSKWDIAVDLELEDFCDCSNVEAVVAVFEEKGVINRGREHVGRAWREGDLGPGTGARLLSLPLSCLAESLFSLSFPMLSLSPLFFVARTALSLFVQTVCLRRVACQQQSCTSARQAHRPGDDRRR